MEMSGQLHVPIGVTWRSQGGGRANAPQIFLLPKNSFLPAGLKRGEKIEIFSKPSCGWCRNRKNEQPAVKESSPSFSLDSFVN
jgi:glutaredoxin